MSMPSHAAAEYRRALRHLYDLQKFGMKLGLRNIRALLRSQGHPERAFPAVHVAGTNGKGSTSSFLASILTMSGYRTGLYTSPHLVRFNERIRIDGKPIGDDRLVRYAMEMRGEIDALKGTFFEATTAMAFRHFAEEKVDIAVIETGLGGRLDATNVLDPELALITRIALEHTEHLGGTLARIAREKAGIVKPGRPLLTGVREIEALHPILRRAEQTGSELFFPDPIVDAPELLDFDRMLFRIEREGRRRKYQAGLAGEHQAENAALAVAAARILAARGWRRISEGSIRGGLALVRVLTGLRGRLERFSAEPELLIDVAHNPDGFEAMLPAYARLRAPERTHLVFGLLANKDRERIGEILGRYPWKSIICTRPASAEGLPAEQLRDALRAVYPKAQSEPDVLRAVRRVTAKILPGESLLLAGSHYLVGDFLARRRR